MQITASEQFKSDFNKMVFNLTTNKIYSSLLFLCIGTDRVIGDSFGPLVGYKLKQVFNNIENVGVIGDLENVVCNINIGKTIKYICEKYSNPFIIAIDSALSTNKEDIGKVLVGKGGIYIGNCMHKSRYFIGDMYIKGVIAKDFGNPKYNFKALQNMRLNNLIQMADMVVNGIHESIEIIK